MKHNTIELMLAISFIGLAITLGAIAMEMQPTTNGQTNTAHVQPAVRYVIKPYAGVGAGVLAPGTLLDLRGKTDYSEPADVVGKLSAPGLWQIKEESSNE